MERMQTGPGPGKCRGLEDVKEPEKDTKKEQLMNISSIQVIEVLRVKIMHCR